LLKQQRYESVEEDLEAEKLTLLVLLDIITRIYSYKAELKECQFHNIVDRSSRENLEIAKHTLLVFAIEGGNVL
jgi:hypothetical protein